MVGDNLHADVVPAVEAGMLAVLIDQDPTADGLVLSGQPNQDPDHGQTWGGAPSAHFCRPRLLH
jgi:FMN phosphatase YigB (HAD superfamily)